MRINNALIFLAQLTVFQLTFLHTFQLVLTIIKLFDKYLDLYIILIAMIST